MKMATPRRTSQQQQQPNSLLSSPPRGSSLPGSPLGSPQAPTDDVTPLPQRGATEDSPDGEVTPASPTPTAAAAASPVLALSASGSGSGSSTASSPTTTEGSGTSSVSTPDSACGNSGSGGGAAGAFRELFEACRNGDVSRVKKLVDAVNVNAKDMAGRKSTPLHFAAGN